MALVAGAACSRTIAPAMSDAAVAFAVRTALVNDPDLGVAPIDVTVVGGVVVLEGRVASEAERARAVSLSRQVAGVRSVTDRLSLGGSAAAEADTARDEAPGRPSNLPGNQVGPLPRWFAVGGVVTVPISQTTTLDGLPSIGPVFRLGRGGGWRPVLTLIRVRADLPEAIGTDAFGELRLLTLGGGLGYGVPFERWTLSFGGTAGWSFNHIRLEPGPRVPVGVTLPVAASSSPALVGGTALWYEATRRVSVGATCAYLWTRPQATWLDGDTFFRQRLDADMVLVGVSVAWWLF